MLQQTIENCPSGRVMAGYLLQRSGTQLLGATGISNPLLSSADRFATLL
jgi:hypothetical protein